MQRNDTLPRNEKRLIIDRPADQPNARVLNWIVWGVAGIIGVLVATLAVAALVALISVVVGTI